MNFPVTDPISKYAKMAGPHVFGNWDLFLTNISKSSKSASKKREKALGAVRTEVENLRAKVLKVLPRAYPGHAEHVLEFEGKVVDFRLDRAATLLALYGKGDKSDEDAFTQYVDAYIKWFCAQLICKSMERRLRPEIHDKEARAHTLHDFNQIIQLKWIADEISMAIGKWVSEKEAGLIPTFGQEVMQGICDSMSLAPIVNPVDVKAAIPENLKPYVTFTAQNAPKEVDLYSRQYDFTPFVDTQFGTLLCNPGGWLLGRDVILLVSLKNALQNSNELTKNWNDKLGKPLEDITCSLSKKWGPADMRWYTPGKYLPPTTDDGDQPTVREMDVVGLSDTTVIVIECKDKNRPKRDNDIEKRFHDKIIGHKEGANQVQNNIKDIQNGLELPDRSTLGNRKLEGIVVTQNHFSGEMWDGRSLATSDISVIPLHQYLLVLSLLESSEELTEYFEQRRNKFREDCYVVLDELELIVPFLTDGSSAISNGDITLPGKQWEATLELKSTSTPSTNHKRQWQRDFIDGLKVA